MAKNNGTPVSKTGDLSSPPPVEAENYIPLRKAELRGRLLTDKALNPTQRQQFAQLCKLLEATLHNEYRERLEQLKDLYAEFDPDGNTIALADDVSTSTGSTERFFDVFLDLLERANFRQLTAANLKEAVEHASSVGMELDVDFTVFERLEMFARGGAQQTRIVPGFWKWGRGRAVEIPVFQRLIMVFRLRDHKRLGKGADTHSIHIKFFKDIPKSDLEMLLPGSQVRISWFDRSKILLPTLSGVALTVIKIVKGVMLVAFAGFYGLLALLGLVGGTIGLGLRSFYSYLNTKDKYHLSLTRSLYFQNLDNNAGVLFRLLDEAEEQDFREAILAYFLLWKGAGRQGLTPEQIDLAAEQFLLDQAGVQVDFEVDDALRKLTSMKLATRVEGGRWCAVDLETALTILDATWDAIFSVDRHKNAMKLPHYRQQASIESPQDSTDWGPVL